MRLCLFDYYCSVSRCFVVLCFTPAKTLCIFIIFLYTPACCMKFYLILRILFARISMGFRKLFVGDSAFIIGLFRSDLIHACWRQARVRLGKGYHIESILPLEPRLLNALLSLLPILTTCNATTDCRR